MNDVGEFDARGSKMPVFTRLGLSFIGALYVGNGESLSAAKTVGLCNGRFRSSLTLSGVFVLTRMVTRAIVYKSAKNIST